MMMEVIDDGLYPRSSSVTLLTANGTIHEDQKRVSI